jgi:hypothetical protein
MAEIVSVIETIQHEIKRREQEITRLKELILMLENKPAEVTQAPAKRGRKPAQPKAVELPRPKRGRPPLNKKVAPTPKKAELAVKPVVEKKAKKVAAPKVEDAIEIITPAVPKKRGPKPGSKRVVKAKTIRKKTVRAVKAKAAPKQKKETVLVRVLGILKSSKQFLDTATISSALAEKYPDKDSDTLNRFMSVSLSNFKKQGLVSASKVDPGGNKYGRYFYGLPTWVDGEGNVKSDFSFQVS